MANSSELTATPSVDDGEQRAVQSTGATSEGLLWRYHHQREQVASNKKAQYQNQFVKSEQYTVQRTCEHNLHL